MSEPELVGEGSFSELRRRLLTEMLNAARSSRGVEKEIHITNLLLIGILGSIKDDNDPCWEQLWYAWGGDLAD